MEPSPVPWILLVALLLFGGIGGCMYGYPRYNVYEQRLTGESELARANYSKQVAVQEAQAKYDSASLLAKADIERAKGAAQAKRILGESLKNNEAYLRYLWIQSLETNTGRVIYVPTEANLPILEASRLK